MRSSISVFKLHAGILATCLLIGCGAGSNSVPYEGTLTLNGQPLADAAVSLQPLTATGAGPFVGTTDSAGKFFLGPPGKPDERGVIPGKYRLTISTQKVAPNESGDDSAKPQILVPERVPDQYRTGDMRVEVPAEGSTAAKFDIMGRP
jgi:hypothetical protein